MRLVHIYSLFSESDNETTERNRVAAKTWESQRWIECGIENGVLPRIFREEGRSFPYVRDLIDAGASSLLPEDIVVLTNTDTCTASNCSDRIIEQISSCDALYGFRKDFHSLKDGPIPDTQIEQGFSYSGSDLYAFRVSWWIKHRDAFPDMILGMEAWDAVLRHLIQYTQPNVNVELCNAIYHWSHTAYCFLPENHYRLIGNRNNLKEAFFWFRTRGVNPSVHSIPVPDDDPNYGRLLIETWSHVLQEVSHIFTWTEPESLAYCAEMASRSTLAVELGTYMGASALTMLRANEKLHLWCVDTFDVAGTQKCCEHFLQREIGSGRCELIKGDSRKASQMLASRSLDIVWVDDGHATEDVKRDISCFLPLVRRGGTIFGHDFEIPHNDVALGVIASLPHWSIPVPRVWSYRKY